jgi:hypothetical protein
MRTSYATPVSLDRPTRASRRDQPPRDHAWDHGALDALGRTFSDRGRSAEQVGGRSLTAALEDGADYPRSDLSHPFRSLGAMSEGFSAFWIPGPNEFDMDDGLRLGYRWLERSAPAGHRVVVLHATKMVSNRPTLRQATKYTVVSPRSRGVPYGDAGAVLAIWPNAPTLEFAEELAFGAPLCVIPYNHDIAWWITKTGATNLTAPDERPDRQCGLPVSVADTLDSILQFGGHNGFLGGGEKEDAVSDLRAMVAAGHRPTPDDLENYARASGETDIDGARRLRGFYEAILAGRTLRDYRGRSI